METSDIAERVQQAADAVAAAQSALTNALALLEEDSDDTQYHILKAATNLREAARVLAELKDCLEDSPEC